MSLIVSVAVLVLITACNDTPTVPANTLIEGSPALSSGGSSDAEVIRVQDKCEPTSFNEVGQEVFGMDLCLTEDGEGPWGEFGPDNVTFQEFADELNPKDFGHGAWRFHPDDTHIDEGEALKAVNQGGEVHTFTEVSAFGAGIVPELNEPLGLTEPAVPVEDLDPTFVGPGGSRTLPDLSVGTHLFMCFIHPWMRLELEVRADD